MNIDATKRIDFVMLYSVENGNPNGDPQTEGNLPRIDETSNRVLVSDVAIKRMVRDYLAQKGYDIYISRGCSLSEKQEGKSISDIKNKYIDVRLFGAVLPQLKKKNKSSKEETGQITGAVQIHIGSSVNVPTIREFTITRCVGEGKNETQTMGTKAMVDFALMRVTGTINPLILSKNQGTQKDIDEFFDALKNMFKFQHSASKGIVTLEKLFVFQHESAYGNAFIRQLIDAINIDCKPIVQSMKDVSITIGELPNGVTLYNF